MEPVNHRTRVGAERRERMRARLVASALQVFASKGYEASDIEDVIAAAQVSRGTFYNYFRTNEELMQAVLEEVSDELISLVDAVVLSRSDPAERVSLGVRMVFHTVRRHALFANFVNRIGIERTLRNSVGARYLVRDLQEGIDQGRFTVSSVHLGFILVLGTMQAAIMALSAEPDLDPNFCEEVTYHLLLGLGVAKGAARKLISLPLQDVAWPVESLLTRTCDLTSLVPPGLGSQGA